MLFLGFLLVGCGSSKNSASDTVDTVTSDTASSVPVPEEDAVEPGPADPGYTSSRRAKHVFALTYDRSVTGDNPLKGFMTSYTWGEPANDFPHRLEFAYIPLKDLIGGDNQYTFASGLEPYLEQASARGNHLVVRIYIDYPSLEYGLPDHLLDLVSCTPYDDHGGGCSPDYSNGHLQAAIVDFIAEFGAQYDGDRRLGFVQMGLLGYWGEWHTYPNSEQFAGDLFQQEVIASFDSAFSQTHVQIRYPVQDTANRQIGFHDDSFAYSTIGDIEWFFWPKIVSSGADMNWQDVPIGGEIYPQLQATIFSDAYVVDEFSQDFAAAVAATHATYMLNYSAFSMNGTGYVDQQYENAIQAAMGLGYEFTLETIDLHAFDLDQDGVNVQLYFTIRNTGAAPFYYPLQLSIGSGDIVFELTGVEDLLPSSSSTHSVWINDLPLSAINEPWHFQLSSPVLLDDQVIHFANAQQQSGVLTVSPDFSCLHDASYVFLGEAIVQQEQTCFCDVDGQFYEVDGTLCFE